ncbi:MAG TPA: lysylphosphatidylglycerol synthase transmembrane domain-containing protein [Burkholderiales bacterium]|nr:lysylphosphatidylglycerol synthase transmembrane domain-containing protein [Burkholderiales bacterium]
MRRTLPLLLKLAVSASLFALIVSRVPLEEAVQRAQDAEPLYLLAALLLILLGVVLVAVRWRLVAGWIGVAIPLSLAVRALFLGFLGGQVLPSAIGGDFLRGWLLARHGAGLTRVVVSLVADRLIGLFGVCLLLILTSPVVRQLPPPYASLLAPVAVLASGMVLAAFLLANRARLRSAPLLAGVVIAILIHALTVAVATLAAKAYGIDAPFEIWLSVIPLAVIAAAIPVSINGWGVREAAIVLLAVPLGIPAAHALLVSMTLGVLNAIASLPGVAVMLSGRRG